jgi:hypothetical protein
MRLIPRSLCAAAVALILAMGMALPTAQAAARPAARAGIHAVVFHGVKKTKRFVIPTTTCPGTGETCPPIRTLTSLVSSSNLSVRFKGGVNLCSDVAVMFYVDGVFAVETQFVDAGQKAPVVTVHWTKDRKSHALGYEAVGELGGCNTGVLTNWAGKVRITYSP